MCVCICVGEATHCTNYHLKILGMEQALNTHSYAMLLKMAQLYTPYSSKFLVVFNNNWLPQYCHVRHIQLQSCHRVPLHGNVSSCHDMDRRFRISCDRAILFWYTCLSHCLFERASEMVLCHICMREFLRQLLSCDKVVHQHIMHFQLEDVFLTDLVDDGLDIGLIWYGVASLKSRHTDVTIHFVELRKRTFSTST